MRDPTNPPPPEPPPGPGVEIPDHTMLRCVGRGAYGEVWLARNMLGSYRAVKIVFRSAFHDSHPYDRELTGIRKFEPVSRSNEGFVNILHIGQSAEEGYFYYVMEIGDDLETGQTINPDSYVPKTLAKQISLLKRLPAEECLQLGLALTRALGRLHSLGLVHRDIKPSNIIFVHGMPKLADVGMVAQVGEARSNVGTAGYMPPEGPNSCAGDIYSLGRVLYEAGTGSELKNYPALPDELAEFPDFPELVELNEVFIKAGQHDWKLRYQNGHEMQADLALLQGGRSVRRLRLIERRLAKAKKAATAALVVLAVAGTAAYQFMLSRNAKAEKLQNRLGAAMAYGIRALEQGDYLASLAPFAEALRLHQGQPALEAVDRVRLGAVLAESPKITQMWFLGDQVNDVRFSADGRLILTSTLEGSPQLWDVQTAKPASPGFGPKGVAVRAALSPDGRYVLTATSDKKATLWDAKTASEIWTLPHPGQVLDAEFSPTGDRVVTACADKKARVYATLTTNLLLTLDSHQDMVQSAEFSPDGRLIVTASQDHTAVIWDAATGTALHEPLQHQSWVYSAVFSPDGNFVVTAGFDLSARLWRVSDGQVFPFAMKHGDGVRSARFSPDGRYIVTAGFDSTARIWDARTGGPVKLNAILQHGSKVLGARFSPDGRQIVTGCVDGTVRVWDLAPALASPRALPGVVSPDGRFWASASNNLVQVGATESADARFPPIVCSGTVEEAGFNANGRFLLVRCSAANPAGPAGKTLEVWNPAAGQAVSPPIPYSGALASACLSEDGRLLALVNGRSARLLDVSSGKERWPRLEIEEVDARAVLDHQAGRLAIFEQNRVYLFDARNGHFAFPNLVLAARVQDVEFSLDDTLMITSVSDDGLNPRPAQIWDTATGKQAGRSLWHEDGVLHGAFSHTGREVVTSSEDRTAIVWKTQTGVPVMPPLRHAEDVTEASFSGNDHWVATASADMTAQIWDARSGEPLTPPLTHEREVRRAMLLDEPPRLVSVTKGGQAWLWELRPDTHSREELTLLTEVLSADLPTAEGRTPQEKLRELEGAWRALNASHPEDFTVSKEQVSAWHRNEARLAEQNGDPAGVDFHLRWLRANGQ